MRLVDISEFYSESGGGVRTYVRQKLDAFWRMGAEAVIIAPGAEDKRERMPGGEIIWVRSPKLAFDHRYHLFSRAKPVHDLLDELAPQVLEASSPWRGAAIAAKWKGAAARALFLHQDPVAVYPQSFLSPLVEEEKVDELCFWFWDYLSRVARNFDRVVVSGPWYAKRIERYCGVKPFVAPMGPEKASFSPNLRAEPLRCEMLRACGVTDENAPLFIAISRFHPEKRLAVVIEAFARLRRTHEAGLYIIGDGPTWRGVKRRAAAVPGVRVAGRITDRDDLARRLASADYFVHGGAAETFGLVVAEALASGLPLVTPHLGGAADLAHPAYAECYRSGDPAAMHAALLRIIGRDRRELALAARAGGNRLKAPEEHFKLLLDEYKFIHSTKSISVAA